MPSEQLAKEGAYTVWTDFLTHTLLAQLVPHLPFIWGELLMGRIPWCDHLREEKNLAEWLKLLGIKVYFGSKSTRVLGTPRGPHSHLLIEMEIAKLEEKNP